jgi:aspartate/glutamate racemase
MIVYFYRLPPMLLNQEGKPVLPIQANPALLEAAKQLGDLVDFLVITANGPHVFKKEIEAASGREVMSMIDPTLTELERRNWKKVGVLILGCTEIPLLLSQETEASDVINPSQLLAEAAVEYSIA